MHNRWLFVTIEVCDEVRTWTIDHRLQRGSDQPWPEIRTANANVDDVGNALAGRAAPATVAYALGERSHAFADFVDPVTDTTNIVPKIGNPRRTQGHVQSGAIFAVDVRTGEQDRKSTRLNSSP